MPSGVLRGAGIRFLPIMIDFLEFGRSDCSRNDPGQFLCKQIGKFNLYCCEYNPCLLANRRRLSTNPMVNISLTILDALNPSITAWFI